MFLPDMQGLNILKIFNDDICNKIRAKGPKNKSSETYNNLCKNCI